MITNRSQILKQTCSFPGIKGLNILPIFYDIEYKNEYCHIVGLTGSKHIPIVSTGFKIQIKTISVKSQYVQYVPPVIYNRS